MKLPSDGAMLLSFLNTKLRDEYSSLDELLEDCGADRGEVEENCARWGMSTTLRATPFAEPWEAYAPLWKCGRVIHTVLLKCG